MHKVLVERLITADVVDVTIPPTVRDQKDKTRNPAPIVERN